MPNRKIWKYTISFNLSSDCQHDLHKKGTSCNILSFFLTIDTMIFGISVNLLVWNQAYLKFNERFPLSPTQSLISKHSTFRFYLSFPIIFSNFLPNRSITAVIRDQYLSFKSISRVFPQGSVQSQLFLSIFYLFSI